MDNKNFYMRRNIQTNIHGLGGIEHNNSKQSGKPNGAIIYNFNSRCNPPKRKMAETLGLKALYLLGFIVGGFAFVANLQAWLEGINSVLHGAITIVLGLSGIVFFYWRIREKREDTRSKELDNKLKALSLEDAETAHKIKLGRK